MVTGKRHDSRRDGTELMLTGGYMESMDIAWVSPKLGGRSSSFADAVVRLGCSKSKNGTTQACIVIYGDLMKELRFISGDRVAVGVTADGKIVVKRVTSGGFALSPSGVGKEKRKDEMGKHRTCAIKFNSMLIKQPKNLLREDISITPDGMLVINP